MGLYEKIVNRQEKISLVGLGYVGMPIAVAFARKAEVIGYDYNAAKIDATPPGRIFTRITLPMISPMILVNAVYTVIDSFTRSENITMKFISDVYVQTPEKSTAMAWIYFLVVILIIAAVAGVASTFIFYQRKD